MTFLFSAALALLPLTETRSQKLPTAHPAGDVELIGFGLVIGLDGTGGHSTLTQQVVLDLKLWLGCIGSERFHQFVSRGMRDRLGPFRWPCNELTENVLRVGDTSAVMVTARLGSGASKGDRIDVTVSCVDDARSLQDGVLLATPLKGPDGQVYVITAQKWSGCFGRSSSFPEGIKGTTATIERGGLVEKSVR